MAELCLVPIFVGVPLIDALRTRLEAVYPMRTRVRAPWFDAEACAEPARGQYNSTLMLSQLLSDPLEKADRILGVASVDLFIPILTYVFGEAQLNGRAAVVSTYRLRSEIYGLAPDPERMLARLVKEAAHELGHTFGLLHCPNPGCAMQASTYSEDIDLKGATLCDSCRARLPAPASPPPDPRVRF